MTKDNKKKSDNDLKIAAGILGGITAGGIAAYLAGRSEIVLVQCKCGAEYYASAQPNWTKTLSYCQHCGRLGMK